MADYLHCAREIRKIVGRDLTNDEIESLESQLKARAAHMRRIDNGLSFTESIVKAAEDMNTESIDALRLAKRNQARQHLKDTGLLDYIERNWKENPRLGLQAAVAGSSVARMGARFSVAREQQALGVHYQQGMVTELEKNNILHAVKDVEQQRNLARALQEVRKKKPDTTGIPTEIVQGAAIIDRWLEVSRIDSNREGTWIKKADDYVAYQYHDMFKLRRASELLGGTGTNRRAPNRKAWKDYITTRLDEKTFKEVDTESLGRMKAGDDAEKIIQEGRDKFLNSVFDSLSTGLHFSKTGRGEGHVPGERALAKRLSEGRLLFFKDADSWYDYQQIFGEGNVFQSVARSLERRGQTTGLMRGFGPNPEAGYERVKLETLKLAREQDSTFSEVDAAKEMALADRMWAQVTGAANIPGNASSTQFFNALRNIASMSKLGGAVISAFGDLAGVAAELRYQGMSLPEQWGAMLRGATAGYGSAEQRQLLSSMGVGFDYLRSAVASRFDADDGIPGGMTKMMNTFFKMSGLTWWTDTLKGSVALTINHHMALNVGKGFDAIDDDMRRMFKIFSIDEGNWKATQYMTTKIDGDGRMFIDPQKAAAIPDSFIKEQLIATGIKATDARIREYRIEVESKFRQYFSDRADFAVLTPDARTRATLNMGYQPGTIPGEAIRSVMQFKAFPVAVLQKTVGRELYGYSESIAWNPFHENAGRTKSMVGLMQFVATSTILGYFAMEAKAMLRGQSVHKPDDPTDVAKIIGAAMVQGGGAGLLGDFFFGQGVDRFGRSGLSSFLGPTWAAGEDFYTMYQKARSGDPTAGLTLHRALSHVPFMNLFYLRPALNYGVIYGLQEMTNPGTLRKMEKRVEKEQGREFMFPPSQYAVRF